MADFQASLTTGIALDYIPQPTYIEITDMSNYDDTEDGHLITDFAEVRKVTIVRPSKSDYVMASYGTYDSYIEPRVINNDPFIYNLEDDDKDGVWEFYLISVPTWNAASDYTNVYHTVYKNGIFYKTKGLTPNINKDPETIGSLYWEEIDEVDIPSKYRILEHFIITTIDLECCMQNKIASAACSIMENGCVDDLCSDPNKYVFKAMLIKILITYIYTLETNLKWDEAKEVFNRANQICCC